MDTYYFDDDTTISRETSHPNFNKILADDFYIAINDEYSPLGNRIGFKTFKALEEWYYRDESQFMLDFLGFFCETNFGWGEIKFPLIHLRDINKISNILFENENILDDFFKVLIATTFGQFKIKGIVDEFLKSMSQSAIKQQIFITNYLEREYLKDSEAYVKYLQKIFIDLDKLPLEYFE